MTKILIAIVVAIVLALGFLIINKKPAIAPTSEQNQPKNVITVTYQNNAFNPATVRIKVGDAILFANKHTAPIRIASNPHPFHTSFPELDSDTLAPGENYQFIFTKPGEIHYHNHFNPSVGGQVVVE